MQGCRLDPAISSGLGAGFSGSVLDHSRSENRHFVYRFFAQHVYQPDGLILWANKIDFAVDAWAVTREYGVGKGNHWDRN